jgi:hypothetical protein
LKAAFVSSGVSAIGPAPGGDLAVPGRAANIDARMSVQADKVADLSKQIAALDANVRTAAAINAQAAALMVCLSKFHKGVAVHLGNPGQNKRSNQRVASRSQGRSLRMLPCWTKGRREPARHQSFADG